MLLRRNIKWVQMKTKASKEWLFFIVVVIINVLVLEQFTLWNIIYLLASKLLFRWQNQLYLTGWDIVCDQLTENFKRCDVFWKWLQTAGLPDRGNETEQDRIQAREGWSDGTRSPVDKKGCEMSEIAPRLTPHLCFLMHLSRGHQSTHAGSTVTLPLKCATTKLCRVYPLVHNAGEHTSASKTHITSADQYCITEVCSCLWGYSDGWGVLGRNPLLFLCGDRADLSTLPSSDSQFHLLTSLLSLSSYIQGSACGLRSLSVCVGVCVLYMFRQFIVKKKKKRQS